MRRSSVRPASLTGPVVAVAAAALRDTSNEDSFYPNDFYPNDKSK